MERASAPRDLPRPVEPALLAAAVQSAVREVAARDDPLAAIDAAIEALHAAVDGVLPSVFVLEHGRLWVVSQRGYAVVPDGIAVEQGIMGRAVRLARGQVVSDVLSDPDYLAALPTVTSEIAIPLRAGRVIVGVFNVDGERALPDGALALLRPLTAALAPLAGALRAAGGLDLQGVARLFVHLGSLRDPAEIAALAAASLARVVKVESSQVWLWDELGSPVELASWARAGPSGAALSAEDVETVRRLVAPRAVSQVLDSPATKGRRRRKGAIVWLPLRANGKEIGALVGAGDGDGAVDASSLDTAAVLAAHSGASLDAAIALQRERQSAVTDALTGVLNRRGLEERLEREVKSAQQRRLPLSVIVLDCDDFKEINDRAGHEFGDALLREVAAPRPDGSVLNDALTAVRALDAEDAADGVLSRLCKALVFVVGSTGCSASRVVGDYLVDATEHTLREISLGQEAAYRLSDFPVTEETLRTGEARAVSFLDGEVDPAEAFILRALNMNAMLMLPLRVHGRPWGLVELYEMRLRRFSEDDISLAQFLVSHAERRLEVVGASGAPRRRPPVYELPPDSDEPGAPTSR